MSNSICTNKIVQINFNFMPAATIAQHEWPPQSLSAQINSQPTWLVQDQPSIPW